MSEQINPADFIANEADFMRALGINPDLVKAGSISIRFDRGTPVVEFAMMVPVAPQRLGMALVAAAPHDEAEPQAEDKEEVDVPVERPLRSVPKKKAAKKATSGRS